MRILLCIVSFCFFVLTSCTKGGNSNSNTIDTTNNTIDSNKYYFKCSIDNKSINAISKDGLSNGLVLNGTVSTSIGTLSQCTQCSLPGSYCFKVQFGISGQTIGSYRPYLFYIETYEGSDIYQYTFNKDDTTGGYKNFTININKIQQAQTGKPYTGFLTGDFTGKVVRRKINSSGYSIINCSGSFSFNL